MHLVTIMLSSHCFPILALCIALVRDQKRIQLKPPPKVNRHISIVGDQIMLDSQPFRIISGSAHYFRTPHEKWEDILQKMKSAGLNAVSTYVEWSFHEPEERQYSFQGDADLALYLETAAKQKLYVLLRVGPFICSERDLGGFPYWLLGKYPKIQLRTTDNDFMNETRVWLNELFKRVSPYLYGNGGPVILVQVENEYGSFGADTAYKEQLRDMMLEHVGSNALLYTTDGSSYDYFNSGSINGTLTTIDFGAGSAVTGLFQEISHYTKGAPVMNSEFYAGWFTNWGDNTTQKELSSDVVKTLDDILEYNNRKANVNIYVFHGGTNFGFGSGAYEDNKPYYIPVITSYDFDAPMDEAGNPTTKYDDIKKVISKYNPAVKNIPTATPKRAVSFGKVSMRACVRLLSRSGRARLGRRYAAVAGKQLPTFERLRQRAGLVLYETTLKGTGPSHIHIGAPRDRVYVYVDDKFYGIISRMEQTLNVTIKSKPGSNLSLLVENQGRVTKFENDFKGILSEVLHNGEALDGNWTITGFPLEEVKPECEDVPDPANLDQGPVIFTGTFNTTNSSDTYFNPTGWEKGYLWIGEHNLGRYWPNQKPQVTLYVPGVWLQPTTRVHLLELEKAPPNLNVEFTNQPIFT